MSFGKKKKTIAFRYVLIKKSNCDWGGTKCWQMATGCPCKKVIEEKGMVLKIKKMGRLPSWEGNIVVPNQQLSPWREQTFKVVLAGIIAMSHS